LLGNACLAADGRRILIGMRIPRTGGGEVKAVLFGATGMVGQGVPREWLLDPDVESGRRGSTSQAISARPEWQMDLPMATAGEVCGQPGKLRDDCIRTLCDEHVSL
jgi:hypothetical protein